jgi:hypothetical protein
MHGAAIGSMFLRAEEPAPVDTTPPVEVTIEEPPPPEREAPAPAEPPSPASPLPVPVQPPAVRAVATAAAERPSESVLTAEPAPGPANSASQAWAPSWTISRGIDLGLDGGLAIQRSLQGGATRSDVPAPRPDIGGLRHALAERDQGLGIGSGGRFVSAVREVERDIAVLGNSAATVEFTTDGAGHVVSARVLDVTSNEGAWREIVGKVGAAAAQRADLPSPRGKIIRMRIEVAMRLPSGSHGGISAIGNSDGIGGAGDLSDIGAKPRPVVSPRVLSEEAL